MYIKHFFDNIDLYLMYINIMDGDRGVSHLKRLKMIKVTATAFFFLALLFKIFFFSLF